MNIFTTIKLYESSIKEFDLLIHAQRERVKAVIAKYDGYASEEVNEVVQVLKELEHDRAATSYKRNLALKHGAALDFMIRMEDDEL
jgi:hypothetical protein